MGVQMQSFKVLLTNLNNYLSKHADVKAVYRDFTEEEHILEARSLDNGKISIALFSFRENLEMLSSIQINLETENKPTISVINAAKECYKAFQSIDASKTIIIDTNNIRTLFIETAAKLTLFCVNCQVSRKISTLLDDNLNIKDPSVGNYIFRGHSSSAYKLIPSIYRNLSIEDRFGIVNINKLRALYLKSKLSEKYKTVFGHDTLDYDFCAFAQHAKAYSPFLDFTDDVKVALSFATSNTNSVNEYLKKEAALYCLSFDKYVERDSIKLDAIDVYINENKISPFSVIRNKYLFCCSYKDFEVEAFVLRDKTNDRMKYQKGCFLYFQRAVIINGNLLLPMNYGRIRKYSIPSSGNTLTKTKIHEIIRNKYSYYIYDYLMNPYKFFEEAPL